MKIPNLTFAFLLSSIILAGCQAPQTKTTVTIKEPVAVSNEELIIEQVPVIRHGRFTLVEVNQVGDEQDLLSQIIEISIPVSLTKQKLTVTDGLNYALLGSGYDLCDTPAVAKFSKLPLPASHHRLGPMSLTTALKAIAGATWQMQVDQHNRVICFVPNPDLNVVNVVLDALSDKGVQ